MGARVVGVGQPGAARMLATAAIATVVLALVIGAPAAGASVPPAMTFAPTGGEQTYTVPAGVTMVNVVAVGAHGGGGSGAGSNNGGPGASGALVSGDLAVTPGEVLYVEVGTPGTDAGISASTGGFNGGGSGGLGGGNGGGASDVRTCSSAAIACAGAAADSLHSRLIVAGGGGGGSAALTGFEPAGGVAGGAAGLVGDPGQDDGQPSIDGPGTGGQGGTDAVGGAGGITNVGPGGPPDCSTNPPGNDGTFGTGGATSPVASAGGGGGGGYWGGGGGGGGCMSGIFPVEAPGGGGGGGSSYGPPGSSFVASVSRPPSVTIAPLPAPSLQASPGGLTFPAQAQGTLSAAQTLTLTNAGPGALVISGLQFTGADAGEFLIDSWTCAGSIPTGSSCQLTVRFAPAAQGPRSAALVVASNDPAGPLRVPLSGTGSALPVGPQGPPGTQGPAGKVELVSCRTVTRTVTRVVHHKRRKVKVHQQKCTSRLVSGPVRFTTSGSAAKASLSRGGVVFATGTETAMGSGRERLVLTPRRALRPGRYTLTLRARSHNRTTPTRTTITIA